MLTDKELLIKALENWANPALKQMFSSSPILKAFSFLSPLVKMPIRKYSKYLDMFTDENDNINTDEIFNLFLEEIEAKGGIQIGSIVINRKDILYLRDEYSKLKQQNV
ncbi:hypothetical protein [uncultured phage cr118_1]|uniref:Uncharacterized protein n=1 Tax=uncultured phage cr118_1 TaxID=2772063 RepID=A0A7M1RXU1_9CAUD|nr:hypothetical protein KNV30_gp90 [uncultured phage cr118_1]QOR58449.1 hypothetical protein [uncultured phage cr118_1]